MDYKNAFDARFIGGPSDDLHLAECVTEDFLEQLVQEFAVLRVRRLVWSKCGL
jgi:hypothetical protein